MYSLLEYSKKDKKTTGSLWNHYNDEPISRINNGVNYSIMCSKSFDYKGYFVEDGATHNNLTKNDVNIVVSLNLFKQFLEKFKYIAD